MHLSWKPKLNRKPRFFLRNLPKPTDRKHLETVTMTGTERSSVLGGRWEESFLIHWWYRRKHLNKCKHHQSHTQFSQPLSLCSCNPVSAMLLTCCHPCSTTNIYLITNCRSLLLMCITLSLISISWFILSTLSHHRLSASDLLHLARHVISYCGLTISPFVTDLLFFASVLKPTHFTNPSYLLPSRLPSQTWTSFFVILCYGSMLAGLLWGEDTRVFTGVTYTICTV